MGRSLKKNKTKKHKRKTKNFPPKRNIDRNNNNAILKLPTSGMIIQNQPKPKTQITKINNSKNININIFPNKCNDKEEILKKLLKNILDVKLNHLEKRTQDQIKDLKYTIDISKKQQLLLTKISLIKIEPKKPRNNNHNREIRTRDRSRDITPLNIRTNRRNSIKKEIKNIKSKTPDAGIRKRRIERNIKETTINIKTDLRPVKKIIPKNNNKIPSYMMPTSSNANKNRRNNDKSVDRNSGRNKRERRALTADDRVKNKKSIKKKNKVNLNIENNLKIDDIKIEDMKIHIPIEEIEEIYQLSLKNSKNSIKNKNKTQNNMKNKKIIMKI